MFKEKYVTISDSKTELADYVRLGGFPATHLQAYSQDEIYTIVRDIYNSTIFSEYDLQGKEILKTQEKFYLADVCLRYSVLGYNADNVASSLENIVYLELCRRGYTVNIGKNSGGEIDFMAVRQNEKIYVQVMQEIRSEKTEI